MVNKSTILVGGDVRTTVCVKNVPKEWNRKQFFHEMRAVIPHGVNFVFLPYDPKTGMNQGYGYVDVNHCFFLIDFVDRLEGQWLDEIAPCELEYTEVQGEESFRAWSELLVPHDWKPYRSPS
jgi:hypothetical protein